MSCVGFSTPAAAPTAARAPSALASTLLRPAARPVVARRQLAGRPIRAFGAQERPTKRITFHAVAEQATTPAPASTTLTSEGPGSTFETEFEVLIKARYPVIYIPSREEDRLEAEIRRIARKTNRSVVVWDFVEGYMGSPNDDGFGKRNPLQALELMKKFPPQAPVIFLLKDYNRFLSDVSVSRQLRNVSKLLKGQPKNLVIMAADVDVPIELREVVQICEFPLPTATELKSEIARVVTALQAQSAAGSELPEDFVEELVRSCQGLSLDRVRKVLSRALATHGSIRVEDLDMILEEKRQLIRQTQILEYVPTSAELDDIGGLENLKEWLVTRENAFSDAARAYGLPFPRGLLLVGVQGTGKSLSAKAIAHRWRLPLLRLDVGRLFGGVVGESEARTRQMIQTAEALAPCILWIDEIDKAFSEKSRGGDGGTASRVFGSFITWLGEKNSPVFVVSTANQVQTLPPELLRKGRFDEVFFVGLPSERERRAIFEVHLRKLRPERLPEFRLDELAAQTPEFSGAEIEQLIIEAMHVGFTQGREFTTEDVLDAIRDAVPLARTAREEIGELETWAASGRARLASRRVARSTPADERRSPKADTPDE